MYHIKYCYGIELSLKTNGIVIRKLYIFKYTKKVIKHVFFNNSPLFYVIIFILI